MSSSPESWRHVVAEYNRMRDPADRGAICQAPFVSLNFDQHGNAAACCYNRQYQLGSYPKDTLDEIWRGERIRKLREHMKAFDLSRGCNLCRQQLEAGNIGGLRARPFDGVDRKPGLKPSAEPMPRMMEFEISNLCNLECAMCTGFFSSLIRKNREKLEPTLNPYDDAFVEQLRPFLPYLGEARFLGGEPFLNRLYFKIWDAIAELNPSIEVSITTNATLMTDKVRKVLETIRPMITVSCDSLDKKTYESIRIGADFDQVRANIDELLVFSRIYGTGLSISVCPMTRNWHTIPELLSFCDERMIYIFFNTVMWPEELSLRFLPRGDLARIVSVLEKSAPSSERQDARGVFANNKRVYDGLLKQLHAWAGSRADG